MYKIERYPLSETQKGFYYDWLRNPQLKEYNVPYMFKYSLNIDADRLERALRTVLDSHPVYHTRIVVENGNVYQYPDLERRIPIERVCIEEKDIYEWSRKFVRPFDLYNEPLIHAAIVQTPESVYFFFDTQHLVSDGTTMMLFANDLNDAYCGKELVPEATNFFDYVLKEQASFETEEYKAAREYQISKFSGLTMSKVRTQSSDKVGKLLSKSCMVPSPQVDAFCKEQGVSPNLLFMAAYAYALSVFSKDNNVVFYTVNHGRTERKFRKSFGPFIKSTPILASISDDITVLDFIQSMKREIMNTIRYGIYPFSHFCQELSIVPETSFTFQAGIEEKDTLDDETIHVKLLPIGAVNSNMAVVIFLFGEEYEIRLEYNENRHATFEMRQFVQCMHDVVMAMMRQPAASLSDFSWMPQTQVEHLLKLSAGNQVEREEATFVELFKRQARLTPSRVAVVDKDSQLTYKDLDNASDALAAVLQSRGVVNNEFVGIKMPRNKEWLIAILGIFKCGAAYLPLANDYPDSRIEYMLNDSEVKIVLTEKDFLNLDTEVAFEEVHANVNNHAYMIYTSGSTGKPKGVVISQRALSSFLRSCRDLYQLDEHDRIFCHSSFSFDASVEDIFPILTCGGEIHILADNIVKEPVSIAQYIQKNQITGGNFTTRLGVEMLKHFNLPLKYITLGGERLDVVPTSTARVFNSYGPTEFTVDASFCEMSEQTCKGTIPIGRPIDNSYALVLDEKMNLVPEGCVGELFLTGEQLADGYWHNDELTKTKFISNPFAKETGNTLLYGTGDLVWWNDKGMLEYVGRKDKQIKISGFRIEIGEIENVLLNCEGIKEVVVDIKEISNIKRICAYYTADAPLDEEAIYKEIEESLPYYMLPWSLTYMESFPLLSSGKVDYQQLPVQLQDGSEEYVAPETVDETVVETLVKNILDIDCVGVETDLFSLGLTSLQTMQLAFDAEAMGIHLPVSNVYEERTIRGSLKSEQNYYFWASEYDPSKPLMVLICGYPFFHPFYDGFMNFFKDKYSIFVVESFLGNFYKQKEVNLQKLLDFYVKITKLAIGDIPIDVVAGFCMGAEIACHYATRLQMENIASPKVLVVGGFFSRDKMSYPNKGKVDELLAEYSRISSDLEKSFPRINYQGEMIIVMAKNFTNRLALESDEETDEVILQKARDIFTTNKLDWKKAYPNTPYIEVDANHWTYFEKKSLDEIWKFMKQCWF